MGAVFGVILLLMRLYILGVVVVMGENPLFYPFSIISVIFAVFVALGERVRLATISLLISLVVITIFGLMGQFDIVIIVVIYDYLATYICLLLLLIFGAGKISLDYYTRYAKFGAKG